MAVEQFQLKVISQNSIHISASEWSTAIQTHPQSKRFCLFSFFFGLLFFFDIFFLSSLAFFFFFSSFFLFLFFFFFFSCCLFLQGVSFFPPSFSQRCFDPHPTTIISTAAWEKLWTALCGGQTRLHQCSILVQMIEDRAKTRAWEFQWTGPKGEPSGRGGVGGGAYLRGSRQEKLAWAVGNGLGGAEGGGGGSVSGQGLRELGWSGSRMTLAG